MALGDLCYKSGGSALCFKSGGTSLVYKTAPTCEVRIEFTKSYTCAKYSQYHELTTNFKVFLAQNCDWERTGSYNIPYTGGTNSQYVYKVKARGEACFAVTCTATTPCSDQTEKCFWWNLVVRVGGKIVLNGDEEYKANGMLRRFNVYFDSSGYPTKLE